MSIAAHVMRVAVFSEAAAQESQQPGDDGQDGPIARYLVISDEAKALECVVLVALEMWPSPGMTIFLLEDIWKLSGFLLCAPEKGDDASTWLEIRCIS